MTDKEKKEKYRKFFNEYKSYIRFFPILCRLNIPQPNFSQFLNGDNNNALSVKRLEKIRKEIIKVSKDIIESEGI